MREPTKAQVKEFWEGCGFKVALGRMYWYPDGGSAKVLPPIDLNNLFKYAVPKLYSCDLAKLGPPDQYGGWFAYVRLGDRTGKAIFIEDKDPVRALFWACCKVLKEE